MTARSRISSNPYLPNGLLNPDALVDFEQAAELTGKSVPTMRNRRNDGLLPHATKRAEDPTGKWWVPVSDLVTSGDLKPGLVGDSPDSQRVMQQEADLIRLNAEREGLRREVDLQRRLITTLQQQIEVLGRDKACLQDHIAFLQSMCDRTPAAVL